MSSDPQDQNGESYKKGDIIGGRYEVHRLLGIGGFGVVYLAYDIDCEELCAIKTFKDEFLADAAQRAAFKKEALVWASLDNHPFIVWARWVDEFSGRLFVEMDYMAPDNKGRVSLADHLASAGEPLDVDQSLKWAIQFCIGMEHAVANGIKCHRDIKPANILITQDGTLKITDFGLAAAAAVAWCGASGQRGSVVTGNAEHGFGLSMLETDGKGCCGTPGYISPEVYRYGTADIRSDIYSFGLVLWQMATGSTSPPFIVPYHGDMEGFLRGVYRQQLTCPVPPVKEPMCRLIERCLKPDPAERYQRFGELHDDLAMILWKKTGMSVEVPEVGERSAVFWSNKGGGLVNLGQNEEAIACFDKALAVDPKYAMAWNNKGRVLTNLGRHEEAFKCYDKALEIDPRHILALTNKGQGLTKLGRQEEAIRCFDQALVIDPLNATSWTNKGLPLAALGRHEEIIKCCDRALEIDPLNAAACNNKGVALLALERHDEAIQCCDKSLAINPLNARVWHNKGLALSKLGRHEETIVCYDKELTIDPRSAEAWTGKGLHLTALGRHEEAIKCYDQVLAIDSRDVVAWFNKATSLRQLRQTHEEVICLRKFIELASPQCATQITYALKRIQELENQ